MNIHLAVVMKPVESMTPQDAMRELGKLSQWAMDARLRALQEGLDAIHDSYFELSLTIKNKQQGLLSSHPELVLMVTDGKRCAKR